ncbi:glycosyltransferase family 4 protein [Azospirillum soli]|uniref:glycosyltransferase family 4 protein n=1 Tax=Azospirillum soli TaxID=1304799 RepID=UPI001AE71A56|nr:glycosyltransferase family 4 protein [Azospirillum soli]MBP2311563.1 glycosyltransferase involved in cell wall biosynthesis [Azospirillum soli]
MRIAFYAPLKAPTHPVPSGDRRMARLLMAALEAGGHEVTLACTLRSWDDGRISGRAKRLAVLGARCAGRLIMRWRDDPPNLWFTYHLYHKAPDWIGPAVSRHFGIPYVVAEASFAPKQATGPFAAGHRAAEAAIRQAAAVINLAGHDAEGVLPLLDSPDRLVRLRPFVETELFAVPRESARQALADRYGLPTNVPWLLAVGMMRGGDKERSYAILAEAIRRLSPAPAKRGRVGVGASTLTPEWRLLVVGDGPQRGAIESLFDGTATHFLGQRDAAELPGLYAACDLMVWPAVNEAYGMALLEAQSAGLPVVAGNTGGVPDIVRHAVTGLLTPVSEVAAFADAINVLILNPERRRAYGDAARQIAVAEHDVSNAVRVLDNLVQHVALKGKP